MAFASDYWMVAIYVVFQMLVFGLALAGDGCIAVNVLFGARRGLNPLFWGGCVGFGHCAVAFLAYFGASRWMGLLQDTLLIGFLLLMFVVVQLINDAVQPEGEDGEEEEHGLNGVQIFLLSLVGSLLFRALSQHFIWWQSALIVGGLGFGAKSALAGVERLRDAVSTQRRLTHIGFVILGLLFSADSSIQGIILASETIPPEQQTQLMKQMRLHEHRHGSDASLMKLVSQGREQWAALITVGIGVAIAFWTTLFGIAVRNPVFRSSHRWLQFAAIGLLIRFAVGDFLWRYFVLRSVVPWESSESFKLVAAGIALAVVTVVARSGHAAAQPAASA
jgi:hypothetical protein